MARRFNPYYANEGRYGGVGQAIGNLGEVFAQANDPSQDIAVDQAAWASRKNREDVIDTTAARRGRENLGNVFAEYDPETYDPRQVLSEGVSSGAYGPDEIGDLFRVASGNLPGMSDDQRAGAAFGSGDFIGPDDAVSLQDREAVANRNASFDQEMQDIKEAGDYKTAMGVQDLRNQVQTTDETLASLFMNEGPEAAMQARPVLKGPDSEETGTGQAVQYELADGTTSSGIFNNRTGYLDSQGQPMNMDSVANVARIGQPQGSNEELGLTTGAQTAAQKNEMNLANVNDMIGWGREIGEDERNFGVSGWARRTVQDAIQQGDAMAKTLNNEASAVQEDILGTGGSVGLDQFDPDISQLDMMKNMLAYQVAKLNDPSGRVSDRDYAAAKESIGFGRPLTNKADFMSRLDLLERITQGQRGNINDRMGGGETDLNMGDAFNAPEGGQDEQGGQTPQRPAPQQDGPRPGDVDVDDETGERYRFLGGDQADPANWERVE